jgi:putative ATPase
MLVSPATLERWFALDAAGERPSYAQHLLRRLTADELAEVGALFRRQLAGQTVPWRTRIVFVVAQLPEG